MTGDESILSELGENRSTADRPASGAGERSAPLSVDQVLDGLVEGFFALELELEVHRLQSRRRRHV